MLHFPLLLLTFILSAHASINGIIGPSDERRLLEALVKAFTKLQEGDVISIYYGAKGFNLLNQQIVAVLVRDSCMHLESQFRKDSPPEPSFHALSAWSLLKCQGKLHTDATINGLKAVLESEKSSPTDIRYAAETLLLLGQSIATPNKVAQFLQARLKEDDNLQSLGHALHAASLLGNAGKFILDRIEDVIIQADEVDGRMLQWEGGLTTTGLLLTGLLKLPNAKPLTETQADKFATYLLSRRSVQTPKGALALIQAAQALAASNVSPVSVTIIGAPQVTQDKPDLHVKISNILGQELKPAPTPVLALSATRVTDDVVVLSKQPLTPGKEPTEYILPLRLEPGQYSLALNAGKYSSTLTVLVSGPIKLQSLDIGLGDADGTSAPKMTKLDYKSELQTPLQADATHNLIVKFSLPRPVHQTFLRLYSKKREIIFIAEKDSNLLYKINVNLASELGHSGIFKMELILGDAIMSNPIRWNLGTVEVNLPTPEPTKTVKLGPKPELKHLFRKPDKRPPHFVSMLFTALAVSPLLLLLILWLKIGINFGNFSFTAVPFHTGLASILALFTLFWLRLDMFTTCGWLIPLGGFTFLSGNRLLNKIARQKKH
ncbi:hypothetical protein Trydic_g10444 [Trypoxylus dichotomus]